MHSRLAFSVKRVTGNSMFSVTHRKELVSKQAPIIPVSWMLCW